RLPLEAKRCADSLRERGVIAGLPLSRYLAGRERDLLVCATELTTDADIARFAAELTKETSRAAAAV
ncbi:MAG TPA: hypothetical protein VEJ20_05990, partial [Candidatus Eremiobacteraceae bacterium]|nr:hypothetical protein [Candidatus Eremiobacteraceae bacterium]